MLSPLTYEAAAGQILVVWKGLLVDAMFLGIPLQFDVQCVCECVKRAPLPCECANTMDIGFVFSLSLTLIFVPLLTLWYIMLMTWDLHRFIYLFLRRHLSSPLTGICLHGKIPFELNCEYSAFFCSFFRKFPTRFGPIWSRNVCQTWTASNK